MKTYFLSIISFVFLLQSCNNDDNSSTLPEETYNVKVTDNATFGKIITDSEGNTLYFFSRDADGTSACTGGCTDIWPVFYVENVEQSPELKSADFGVITLASGEKQTTYKGWPLYYFANDVNAGDTNGDKVNDIWYVAKPDYSLMYVKAQLKGRTSAGEEILLKSDYTEGEEETFYITDDYGNTLYSFTPDKKSTNTFTAPDLSNNGVWPIFHTDIDQLPSILNASDFDSFEIYGVKQLTYKGWPLYKFGQDMARGDNYGTGFPMPGVWPVVNTGTEPAPLP